MARIKKYAPTLNEKLTTFQTFIVDTNPNSDYFRISEFKETLTGGKNGFQIEGSEHLLESTEIKLEILDVEGNPIYYEPGDGIPEYYEGISKIVSVHIYEDTPIGEAIVTVLGELKTYVDADGVVKDVPTEWKGIYNCKWERTVKINKFLSNEDKVRFYKRPKVSITEIVKPLFSNVVTPKTNTGNVSGIPLFPIAGTNLSQYTLPTSYLLKITDTGNFSAWTGSVVGNTISIPSLNYTTTAEEVINKTELVVTTPYTQNGLISSFTNTPYTTTFNYTEGLDNLATALTGSFAKITLTDLTSFVGDVARVKVFRKSQTDLSDFQFVQEIQLEANELLVDLTTTNKNQENYGLFTTDIINNYWIESSPNITATYNQTYLYDSAKLDSVSGPNTFRTTEYIPITKDVEYTLDFNIRLGANASTNNYIRAFLSGSLNGGTIQIEQDITTIISSDSLLQKTISTNNIKAQEIENARLYFEVVGSNWYIANVSLRASKETAFSPDEITFIQPVPRSLPVQTFIYKFEFYDINNNYIPVLVEKQKTFNGGNLQTIQKSLQLLPSSLYFQFDSGSNPVPPTSINIKVVKTLLTGSVRYTSQSFDYDGSTHTALQYAGGQYPGVLNQTNPDNLILTVANFTGSRSDKNVQYLEITGEVEGFTDTIVITKVLDGFGGVNYIIRPYRGTQIRNSSTASLEIQAVRIDGVNEIILNDTIGRAKGWHTYQLHVLSASLDPLNEPEKFINLQKAVNQNYIKGLSVGQLGSKQLNYNAIFNRDSINKVRVVYILSSGSITQQPAFIASASVLSSINLEDLQDGLDAGFMAYNTDTFTINPRTQTIFTPVSASVTGSFYKRGTNAEPFTASFEVFPSMSLNIDYEPEYWMYYVTGKFHPNISVVAIDEKKRTIPSRAVSSYTGLPISQSKTLTVTLTYTEDYTSSSISLDKTFTIVPQGKPGDESIVFEVVPANVTLNSNSEGIVLDYKPSITDIKLKQGSRYLVFTGSRDAGTFHIASSSISSQNITPGNVHFTSSFGVPYTASLIVSASSNLTDLSGSITYPLIIHPYYTSSIYTQSIVQNYTKAVDGPPQIDVIITPTNITLNADEVGYVSTYASAQSTIQLKEAGKFLVFNTSSTSPGTFRFLTSASKNITASLSGVGTTTATASFSRFDYPYVSASITYNILAHPYSLGPGHRFTSSVFERTQNITKNVSAAAARSVKLAASSYSVTYDSDGQVVNPTDGITLVATAFNTTGSKYYQFFKDDISQGPITAVATRTIGPEDAVAAGEIATWKVTLRDGSSSTAAPIKAQDSITITGIQDGIKAYNAVVNPENTSIVYKVSGELEITNTSVVITATKGGQILTHKPSGFSAQSQDPFGNNIGSLGEYQVTIHSVSGHIVLGDSKVSASVLNGSTNATISNLAGWVNPEGNPTGQIVYRVNFENGKQITFKTQSIAIQFEGATGPGIVMRGVWNNTTDYIGSVETTNYRRDAVIWPDPGNSGGNTRYYAAISGSGPGTATGYHAPDTAPADSAWWQYLGEQDFFVAAKIAIFDESFVKNTLNVGNNAGSPFANIVLAGGRDDPYMAIGQNGTVGGNGIQYNPSTYPTIIGYDKIGIFAGMFNNASVYEPRFSLRGSGGNYLRWNGSSLDINGAISASSGNFVGNMTVAGGSMKFGADVNGTNDGIYINANNYWYDTGNFKVGNATSYIDWNGTTMEVKGSITVTGGDAATQTYASQSAATALTSTLTIVNKLADGTYSVPGNTFITNTTISAPVIAGTAGYFEKLFRVGDNTAASVYLDARNIADGAPDNYRRIWIGTGTYGDFGNGTNTSFYVDSNGRFSLGNKLTFTGGNLTISGDITATSGTFSGTINASGGTFTGYVTGGTARFGANVSGTDDGLYLDANNYWFDGEGRFKMGNSSNYLSWDGTAGATGVIAYSGTTNAAFYAYGPSIGSAYAAIYITDGGLKVANTYSANGGYAIQSVGNLYTTGEVRATGNIIAYYSDERLKTKLGNINNAVDKLSQLNGFYYKNNDVAKSFGYTDDKTQLGLSAQEVQSVFPDIIHQAPFDMENSDGGSKSGENYLTLDYSKLVPVLVEAIKELKAEIEELKRNK